MSNVGHSLAESLVDSLQSAVRSNSDASLYNPQPTKRYQSFIQKEQKDLEHQKIWVSCHTLLFIMIALETMYLLHQKDHDLSQFYDSQSQCCYCAWIARNGTFNNQKEIEYSHCKQTYNAPYDTSQICTLQHEDTPTQYCTETFSDMLQHDVSINSTFLFIPFPKSYLYYGILCLALVSLYCLGILIATFKYKIHLSSLLFVGNILISIQCYYNYIKAYQYNKTTYSSDAICSNTPLPHDSYEPACYQNVIVSAESKLLSVMVSFFEIYLLYPIVFCVFGCIRKKCCHGGERIVIIRSYIERILLYIGVIAGLSAVILCFVVLITIVAAPEFRFLSWIDNAMERYLCILIGIALFIASWSVFCLPRCRAKCGILIKARIPQWRNAIHTMDTDEVIENIDLETRATSISEKRPHSPLLEKC